MKRIYLIAALIVGLGALGLHLANRPDGRTASDSHQRRVVSMVAPGSGPEPNEITTDAGLSTAAVAPAGALRKAFRREDAEGAAQAAGALADVDPQRALVLVDELVPEWRSAASLGEVTKAALGAILSSWAGGDPAAAAEWAEAAPDVLHAGAVTLVASLWSEQDPVATARWIRQQSPGDARDGAATMAALRLAPRQPREAIDIAREISKVEMRNTVISDIGHYYASASNGLDATLMAVEALAGSEPRATLLESVRTRWGRADPQTLLARLVTLRLGRGVDGAQARLLADWTRMEPDAALAFADTIPEAGGRDEAMGAVGLVLAETDLDAALTVAEQLKESVARSRLLAAVAGRWAIMDATGASTWLGTLPDGIGRDEAVFAFVRAIYETEPAAALVWLDSVGDSHRQKGFAKMVVDVWLPVDPDGARAWMASATLSEGFRAHLHALSEATK